MERTDVARRIVAIDEAIADTVAEDDQVLVHNGRRRIRVVRPVDRPDQPLAEIDDAVRAERLDDLTGCRVEADEPVAAVDEDPQLVAGRAVAPGRDTAVHEPRPIRRLSVFVRFRIEGPEL